MSVARALADRRPTNERCSLPKPLRMFFIVAIILNLMALACETVAIFALNLGMPYKSPIFNEAWAVDLTNYQRLFPFIHTPGFFQTIRGITFKSSTSVSPIWAREVAANSAKETQASKSHRIP